MRLDTLKLRNFLSHPETDIDFAGMQSVVLSGLNGSGKTSILDAILFALFGASRRSIDSVVMRGEEVGSVELTFFDDHGEQYLVIRLRSLKGAGKTELGFFHIQQGEPVPLGGKTIDDKQAAIEEVTGLTAELLRMTAISAYKDSDAFPRAKAVDRKACLSTILGLGLFDQLAAAGRLRVRLLEATRETTATALEAADRTAAQVPLLDTQIAEAVAEGSVLEEQERKGGEAAAALVTEREEAVRAQATDGAARKERTDLVSQAAAAEQALTAAAEVVQGIGQKMAEKPNVEKLVGEATAAQAEREKLDVALRRREHLVSAARAYGVDIKAQQAEHSAAVAKLSAVVVTAKREQKKDHQQKADEFARLTKQAELLDDIPCVGSPAAERCPLIEQALAAKAALPKVQEELQAIAKHEPWVDDEKATEALAAETPWADVVEKRAAAKVEYDGIEYDEARHAQVRELAADLPKHQEALTRIAAAEEQLPLAKQTFEAAAGKRALLTERQAALSAKLGEPKAWATLLATLEAKQVEVKDAQARTRRGMEVLAERQGALSERLGAAKKAGEEAKTHAATIAALDTRLLHLKMLCNTRDGAFSPGGIPALLIEQAVPELEEAANKVLATLSEGRLSLELRTQRPGKEKRAGVTETLDIVIFDEKGEAYYEEYSGGETMRIDLALRAALTGLLARRANARCELLVLDETAAPLDEPGQQQFVAALAAIAELEKMLVLCVSHLPSLKEEFPVRIEVTKDAAGSHVEVIR